MAQRVMTDEVGVRFGMSGGVLFALAALIVASGLRGTLGVVVLFLATTVLATAMDTRHSLLLGLAGWAFATGFAVNTSGVLTLAQLDLLRLVVFVVAALVTSRRGTLG
ncbi:hypothetical protein [Nocardioides sp. HB32]